METFLSILLLTFLGTLYTAQASPVGLSELTQLLEQENFPFSAQTQDVRRKRSVMGNGVLGLLTVGPNRHGTSSILDVGEKQPNDDHSVSVLSLKVLEQLAGNSQQAVEEKSEPQSQQPQGNGIMFVVQSSDPETQKQLNKLTKEEHHKLATLVLAKRMQEQGTLNNSAVQVLVGNTQNR